MSKLVIKYNMEILNLEQGSDEWHKARQGKITGTKLIKVLTTKAKRADLINEMIAEKLTGTSDKIIPSEDMKRGTMLESYAIEEYELLTGDKVEQVGFCISEDIDLLAISPDGLIKNQGVYVRGVEVKCPKTKTVVKYIRDDKIPKEYKYQVLTYFLVIDTLEDLDFVIYDPRITNELSLYVIRVNREDLEKDIKKAKEELKSFKKELNKELGKVLSEE